MESRIFRTGTLVIVLGLLGAAGACSGGPTSGQSDLATLEGSTLRAVHQNNLRMLSIMGRTVTRMAQREGRMTPELTALVETAIQAGENGRPTDAFRYAIRIITVLSGGELTEGLEVGTSFDLLIDKKIVSPGEELRITLDPLFTLGRPLSKTYTARMSVRTSDGETVAAPSLSIRELEPTSASIATADLEPGRYVVFYELFDEADSRIIFGFRDFIVDATTAERVAGLESKLASIREMELAGIRKQAAAETVEYVSDLIGRAQSEYVSITWKTIHPAVLSIRNVRLTDEQVQQRLESIAGREPFTLDEDLALAESLADDLLAGKDPFAGRIGDLHLAHRSSIDGTLQPYSVFIPEGYDAATQYPLIIGLHGASGNEYSFLGRSGFKEQAQERGYVMAAPNGRGSFVGYQEIGGTDVLEVLDRMLAMYAIDPGQVFLTGHSMGGGGTWIVGCRAPDRFAAMAPIAGAPPPTMLDLDAIIGMPVLFSAGVQDRTVPIAMVRRLAKVADQKLERLTYVEYPDDEHNDVPFSAMRSVFDFFDSHRGSSGGAQPANRTVAAGKNGG